MTTQELLDRGFSHTQIEAMVRWAWLLRVHRGIYFVTPPDVFARAALAVVADAAVLCLESALAHHDLRPRPPGAVHVNFLPSARRDRSERVKIHRARIPESDIAVVRGLRTTTPTRTLLDVAPRQPRYSLLRALEQAERLRLHMQRDRLAASRHLTEPLELFDHYGPCTRSDAEAMFIVLCEDHGVARPLVNRRLAGREADFHWPAEHLAVEVDGYETHQGRAAFHGGDRRRGGRFRRAGFELLRFSADEVEHDASTVAETVLAARPELNRR